MISHPMTRGALNLAMKTIAFGLVVWLVAPPPAGAFRGGSQFIYGGLKAGASEVLIGFTAPGLSVAYGKNDFTTEGKAERAAQLRIPSNGVLSHFRMQVVTRDTPKRGRLAAVVRINGQGTALGCEISGTGVCSSGAASVNVSKGDRLAIRLSNKLVDAGPTAVSYSMHWD